MSDDETWKEFFERWALGIIEFAAKNPKDFILYCKYENCRAYLIDNVDRVATKRSLQIWRNNEIKFGLNKVKSLRSSIEFFAF